MISGGIEVIINGLIEAVVQRCSVKKLLLEISQKSQKNTCARVSFLIKLQAWLATLLKKRLWQRCLPVNFTEFLRTTFSYRTPPVAAFGALTGEAYSETIQPSKIELFTKVVIGF